MHSILLILLYLLPPSSVEQPSQGKRPAVPQLVHFDRMSGGRNPSDNSPPLGPQHIAEIVTSRIAVYDKQGKVLRASAPTNSIFAGFGGRCEARNNGDAVVRYDQLAKRWLIVMPLFSKAPDTTQPPYSMCYAVSQTGDPLGAYHRYEFKRKLFPDYPPPAIWTDGY